MSHTEEPTPLSWLDPRVERRPSPIDGDGLFAHAPIAAGEVVERWGGIRITDVELAVIAASGERFSSAAVAEGANLLFSPDDPINFGNHSCDPNLWLDGATTVVARRDIAPGEELTIDYATLSAGPWSMPCHCGFPLCRHLVTADDWRRPEIQARYAGHFSPFIDARIAS